MFPSRTAEEAWIEAGFPEIRRRLTGLSGMPASAGIDAADQAGIQYMASERGRLSVGGLFATMSSR